MLPFTFTADGVTDTISMSTVCTAEVVIQLQFTGKIADFITMVASSENATDSCKMGLAGTRKNLIQIDAS